jgi:hypothetical protein
MNVYALNATPLGGTATLFGQGAAAHLLDADGRGYLVMHGAGQAQLAANGQGQGIVAVLGEAFLMLSIAATGRATLMLHALAQWAGLALDALGAGTVIPWIGGRARMVMTAQGIGRIAVTATSRAALTLSAVVRGTVATRGAGIAPLTLDGKAGIPRPMRVPASFAPAHPSRRIAVDARPDGIALAPAARTLAVAAEDRTHTVARQRNP